MMTRALYRKRRVKGKSQSSKRKLEEAAAGDNETLQPATTDSKAADIQKPAEKKPKKTKTQQASAAMRPTRTQNASYYLKELKVVYTQSHAKKPIRCVECVNYHKEDIFGEGGENLNKEFTGAHGVYLVPIWTPRREEANVTGFQLVVSSTEDRTKQNLYAGFPEMFVYLVPTFDPSIDDRIIGVQLFRSRSYNPPAYGWSHTTININEGRGGDHLCLQWDLGNEKDLPGGKFRFRFWRR